MNYQKFIAELPNQYEGWGGEAIRPKSPQFQEALAQVEGMTSENILQLLNFAVACMESGEVYCEVGCLYGSTLIGAMLNHPARLAYAIDNFSEFNPGGDNEARLLHNLTAFDMEEQILFCNQDFETFFADLRQLQTTDRIGVYFYDGAHDYRSQMMGLLLVRPFLAERALIILDDSNWDTVQQATCDFLASHSQCRLVLDLPTSARQFSEMFACPFWNGVQVLSWDRQTHPGTPLTDLQKWRKPEVIRAIYEMPRHSFTTVDRQSQQRQAAAQSQAAGRWEEAVAAYQNRVQQNPHDQQTWYDLGICLEQSGQMMDAARAYQRAIALDAHYADAYLSLGNLVAEHGDIQQAELIYQQAIAAAPHLVEGYLKLGIWLTIQGKVEQAIEVYTAGLAQNSDHPELLDQLAFARQLAPDSRATHLFAGNSLYQRHKYPEAVAHFQALVDSSNAPEQADIPALEIYIMLANCYEQVKDYPAAIQTCQRGISHYPEAIPLHTQLIRGLRETNHTEAAIAQATHAAQQFPDQPFFKLQQHLLLPLLYQDEEEIDRYRNRFTHGLASLIEDYFDGTQLGWQEALNQHTNFLLAYQNRDDVGLQRQYGQFVRQVMGSVYSEWAEGQGHRRGAEARRIRVGYVSACFWEHTVGKLMVGWWRHCDRQQFELFTYSLSHKSDKLSAEYRQYSDRFHQVPEDLETICEKILADELDILVFVDLGQHPLLTQVAALRLAPVQCTTWAHPITSGLPTVDYFLSSDLMEPDSGQEHYSEKLIRLPNIGICFATPEVPAPAKSRSAFQLREDAMVYLNSQMLCKCLPQQDQALAAIAQQVPHAQFVFIARPNSEVADQFQQRLKRAFAAVGLDSDRHCVMMPPLNQTDYWNLNQVCDVFLDSFGWSGGHTTLEAIACGLPIVTLPGEFMRGRHSYAILKMLGVTDTIAPTPDKYVEIAVRLGTDTTWRREIVEQMTIRFPHLYNDTACLSALEQFYQQVTRTG
jgi:predicted O-linked N-acetylglucosamine transferase (SPINDLY family)